MDASGREMAEIFLTLPSKKLYPDYYVLIKQPMCLKTIRKRLMAAGSSQQPMSQPPPLAVLRSALHPARCGSGLPADLTCAATAKHQARVSLTSRCSWCFAMLSSTIWQNPRSSRTLNSYRSYVPNRCSFAHFSGTRSTACE